MTSAKDEKIIKELRAKPENKKCMDCTATFPTYVVLDFGTWVCTTCSGIHREFSHKVKSPTMATFKPEEIQIIQHGGNEIARKKWRARWTSSSFPEPESGDVHRIREFIKQTYKEKKWFDASGSSQQQSNHPAPASTSSTNLLKPTAPPATIRHEPKSLIDFDFDVIPNNPTPPVNNNNMYMNPPSTNPFGNPFQAPNNNSNNGLDSMFSNLHVSPNPAPTNPFATPVNNNTPMYDPKVYPPFMPNNNMNPNNNPFPPVNTAPTNPFNIPPPSSNNTSNNTSTFDFDSLATFTSSTPTNTNNATNNATLRPPPATIRQPVAPKETPKQPTQDDTPRCPICNMAFDLKKMTNAEVNVHVDNCLEKGGPEDSWAEWFNLARMEWYFGDIDRKEAEKILFRCSHDSFLVRKSSVKDAFAVSLYNHKKQTVVHSLIEKRSNGWAFQDTYRIYPTLVAVISDSPECKGLVPPPK